MTTRRQVDVTLDFHDNVYTVTMIIPSIRVVCCVNKVIFIGVGVRMENIFHVFEIKPVPPQFLENIVLNTKLKKN